MPDNFWTDNLITSLEDSLQTFQKYKSQIDEKEYFADFVKVLGAYSLRGIVPPPMFQKRVETLLSVNKYRTLALFDAKMTENLIFYLVKTNAYCPDLVTQILQLL